MPTTSLSGLPYPSLTGSNNPPADFQALAVALDPLVTPQVVNYTPAWSQFGGSGLLIGNGTLAGQYVKVGRLVQFLVILTRGSTSNFGTSYYYFSTPVAAAGSPAAVGTGIVIVGGAFKTVTVRLAGSGSFAMMRPDDSQLSNASFSWATGDQIAISGSYISAS